MAQPERWVTKHWRTPFNEIEIVFYVFYHEKTTEAESRKAHFSTAQQVNLPACSLHYPFDAERQAGKL